jgi:recombination protein RecA
MGKIFSRIDVPVVSSGSLRLDRALHIGGLPRGHTCELFGQTGCGKTTLSQHIIAEAQRIKLVCMLIDADHALDVNYAKRCGVNLDKLVISLPRTAEEALDIIERIVRSNSVDVIVVDSINHLLPQVEFEPGQGKGKNKGINQLISQTLRRLAKQLQQSSTLLVFTHSVPERGKVVYHRLKYDPEKLALRYHAAVSIKLVSLGHIRNHNQVIGERIEARILKNRFAPFFDREELVIMYNEGIRKSGEIFDLGIELSLIELRDKFYYYQDHALGSDCESVMETLNDKRAIADQLDQEIRQRL